MFKNGFLILMSVCSVLWVIVMITIYFLNVFLLKLVVYLYHQNKF